MPTTPPKPAAPSTPPAPAPAAPVKEAEVMESSNSGEAVVVGPVVERVTMGGLVLEKTEHPGGDVSVEVLQEPLIAEEVIHQTRASQRQQGF